MKGNVGVKDGRQRVWRCASYARLSKEDGRSGQSDSIQVQNSMMQRWAQDRDDVVLVAAYVDDGYSGANFNRPGFNEMMHDGRCGSFDMIVVKDLSRFGRSYLDCGNLIERELPKLGIRLYSIVEDFDSLSKWDASTALLFPIRNIMNELHVVTTSEKVRASLAEKREQGFFVGSHAPYGYMRHPQDKHRLVIYEPAAQVVRQVFSMRLSGYSASLIAANLNDAGAPSPAASKSISGSAYRTGFCQEACNTRWHAGTVMRILRNECYIGTLVQGKTSTANWRSRDVQQIPCEDWIRTPNAHEAIVDRDTFFKVSRLMEKGNGESKGEYEVPNMVHLACADCGANMHKVTVHGKQRTYVYYICSTHRKNVRLCSPHSIRQELVLQELEDLIWGNLSEGFEHVYVNNDGHLQTRLTTRTNSATVS